MAYERLDLTTGDLLDAEVFKHIEDGICSSLLPENEGSLEESSNILKDSVQYWNSGFLQYPKLDTIQLAYCEVI